ncbi:MAG: complex I NDUFA9 subunit family protein [Sphingomonas fennica]
MEQQLVTLFGGGGFLGRYVAQALLKAGARVRVAERDPSDAFFIRPLGGLGQTQFVGTDITRADSAARAAEGSHAVVNLVGVLKGDFRRMHVEAARNAAAAAAAVGARAFVQVSAIGADPESPSAYGRSKADGERAVREAFAGATIVRPSVLFGPEDDFVNRFGRLIRLLPLVPVLAGETKLQPAWVADVARAIAAAALDPAGHAGRTYHLGGPEVMTMAALNRRIAALTGRNRSFLDLPDSVGAMLANGLGWLPGAPITADQWAMLSRDNVVPAEAAGFEAFGIAPTPLAAVAPGWLVQYRREGRFSLGNPA